MPRFRIVLRRGTDFELNAWIIDHLWPALREAPPGTIIVLDREHTPDLEPSPSPEDR